jgi:transcriptional regulator with XRE-family HTH domain
VAARNASLAALGRAVQAFRVERGISQEELGFRSGMDRTFVGGIERGERNPTYETLVKLSGGLEVAPQDIVSRAQELRDETGG